MNDQSQAKSVAKPKPPTAALRARDIWTIIGLNAIVSLLISLAVVFFVAPALSGNSRVPLEQSLGAALNEPVFPATQVAVAAQATTTVSAANTPTPPPPPTETPQPVVYLVQVGDSLSGIADSFGVSMDDIMTANGFDNPDYLQAGQSLIIPVGGPVELPPTATVQQSPTATELPVEPPSQTDGTPAADISITATPTTTPVPSATAVPLDEVAVEISSVLGYGDRDAEVVTIYNRGAGVNLTGWTMTGSALGDYAFPNLFLWNGGSVRVHSVAGANTPSDLYWEADEAHWLSGDTIAIKDAQGDVVATYTIP